ncbi:MAG: hypothetical protein AB1324_05660 [Candidatus Micrarchaeota archaeon]
MELRHDRLKESITSKKAKAFSFAAAAVMVVGMAFAGGIIKGNGRTAPARAERDVPAMSEGQGCGTVLNDRYGQELKERVSRAVTANSAELRQRSGCEGELTINFLVAPGPGKRVGIADAWVSGAKRPLEPEDIARIARIDLPPVSDDPTNCSLYFQVKTR